MVSEPAISGKAHEKGREEPIEKLKKSSDTIDRFKRTISTYRNIFDIRDFLLADESDKTEIQPEIAASLKKEPEACRLEPEALNNELDVHLEMAPERVIQR